MKREDHDAVFILGQMDKGGERLPNVGVVPGDQTYPERSALPEILRADVDDSDAGSLCEAGLEAIQDGSLVLERPAVGI